MSSADEAGRRSLSIFTAAVVGTALLTFAGAAQAVTYTFDADPFAGSLALTTPGRQIVGGEPLLNSDPAVDRIEVASDVFGVTAPLAIFNGLAADLSNGYEVIVLRDLDANAAVAGNQMSAGLAANLIAGAVTGPGGGVLLLL